MLSARKPTKRTGEELRRFFIELQEGRNLIKYYANRDRYIASRKRTRKGDRTSGYLGPDAVRLLSSPDFREVEDSIRLITGSGSAVIVRVVCPPF